MIRIFQKFKHQSTYFNQLHGGGNCVLEKDTSVSRFHNIALCGSFSDRRADTDIDRSRLDRRHRRPLRAKIPVPSFSYKLAFILIFASFITR